jgi:hypothetical protein
MSGKSNESEQRRARLAKALKGNIAKRKEAARPKQAPPEPPDTPPDDKGCPN